MCACTAAGCSPSSDMVQGYSGVIHPIPKLLLAASNHLQVLDWDLMFSQDIARSNSGPVQHLSYSAREKLLFFFDDHDIIASMLDSNTKYKVSIFKLQ